MSHTHAPAAHTGAAQRRPLALALCLTGTFFVVELVAALLSGSLALLSDAGHMLTDVLGTGMALAAIQAATTGGSGRRRQRSFGLYRLEILAALANAVLLFGVAVVVLVEAVSRFTDPPEVQGGVMLVVAVLGLLANLGALRLLHGGAKENLNVEGAYLEVLADTLGSVAVIIAAVIIQVTGFHLVDPVFGVAIGLFVLPRTYRLGRKALRVLIQAAPPDIDLDRLEAALADVPGVASVHDLHVWTLTSGMDVASVHLRVADGVDGHEVLDHARRILRTEHGVDHATVQVEPADHAGCDDCEAVAW